MDGAEIIAPEVRQLVVGGEPVDIRPLTVGQIPAVLRALKGVDFSAGLTAADLPGLVAEHGDRLIQAVAVAIREPADWVSNLDPVEFLTLAGAVIEVNTDFFVQRLAPMLGAVTQRLARVAATTGAGPTPSRS